MSEPAPDRLIADEYLLLQKRIEEFDSRLLTIKAWSVTFSTAAIGLAWQQSRPELLLVSAISAFAFWLVEANVKFHQRAHYPRLKDIETYFSNPDTAIKPMQIYDSWDKDIHAKGQIWRFIGSIARPIVFLPHIIIIITALVMYFWCPPKEHPSAPRLSIVLR